MSFNHIRNHEKHIRVMGIKDIYLEAQTKALANEHHLLSPCNRLYSRALFHHHQGCILCYSYQHLWTRKCISIEENPRCYRKIPCIYLLRDPFSEEGTVQHQHHAC